MGGNNKHCLFKWFAQGALVLKVLVEVGSNPSLASQNAGIFDYDSWNMIELREVLASHYCGPGSISGEGHLWLEMCVGFFLASE